MNSDSVRMYMASADPMVLLSFCGTGYTTHVSRTIPEVRALIAMLQAAVAEAEQEAEIAA